MSVHYKFKNTINYDAVKFDGVYISAADLKAIIAQQKKLGHSELQVSNEETKQIYSDDQMIPKNTNVIVLRLPHANANKRARIQHGNNQHHHNNQHRSAASSSQGTSGNVSSSASNTGSSMIASSMGGGREALELVSTKNMTEEERLKYIQGQSTKDFDPARYARGGRGGGHHHHRGGGRGTTGGSGSGGSHRPYPSVPGPSYVCRKCGIPGHFISDCKSTSHKVKRSSGIPRDFLMKVDSKEKGALITPSGEFAIPIIDREAYSKPKVEKAPFFEDVIPEEIDTNGDKSSNAPRTSTATSSVNGSRIAGSN